MTPVPFVVQFSEDLHQVRVIDAQDRRLLVVSIIGEVTVERQDRIVNLIGRLLEECLEGTAVIAPFGGDTPS